MIMILSENETNTYSTYYRQGTIICIHLMLTVPNKELK